MNTLNRHKTVIYLIAVFVMGMIAGGAFGYGLARKPFFRPPTRTEMTRHILTDLTRELELTPDQVSQASPIIETAAKQMEEVHKRTFDEVKQIFRTADQELSKFLTPAQRERLEDMNRQRDRRGRGGGSPGTPHGPPSPGGRPPDHAPPDGPPPHDKGPGGTPQGGARLGDPPR